MRKHNFLISIGVISLMAAVPSYAQGTTSPAPAAAPQGQQTQAASPPQEALTALAPDQFGTHKQKLLENISEHIARMQKKQACISAAADEKALDACFAAEAKADAAAAKQ
jgi:hypothetical protein